MSFVGNWVISFIGFGYSKGNVIKITQYITQKLKNYI